ncbi:MAG: VanW family protein [bacterium]
MPQALDAWRRALSCAARRRIRSLQDLLQRRRFANERSREDLPCLILEHRLPLFRNFPGIDRRLFENKRRNLELAAAQLDGVILAPGKVFSLWRRVGPPTARRGYLEGLVLDRGRPARGVGGGLCQMANALFWLALHSELQVLERHHHSVDLFPDDHRKVPFGTGATIVYNFKDLRFRNGSPRRYQFRVKVEERELVASLRCDAAPPHAFQIREEGHRFLEAEDGLYRRNSIVRETRDPSGQLVSVRPLFENFSKCQYTLQEAL